MRLIELSANRSSFKTVRFNRIGLSLVVGRHTRKESRNIHATYNGVGKSLLVALIHFCLGANRNKQFEAHLDEWEFTLVFEHGGSTHTVVRTVGADKLDFNGNELRLSQYKKALNELGVFDLPADVSALTFRSLINFFIRPSRSSYNSPAGAVEQWTPYFRVLYQSFLLGLDYYLVVQKHDAKKHLDEQIELANRYKKDKELREFYIGEKNAEMELASLRERIANLQRNIASFTVAEDYGRRQAEADALHAQILEAHNEETLFSLRLKDIELAMSVRPDVTPARLRQLYAEAAFALPATVLKRLDEVDQFHERLRENRTRRLEQERARSLAELKNWQERRASMEAQLDSLLKYLSAHRALDEYTENNRFLAELTAKARKIEDYLTLLTRYTDAAQRIREEMAKATVQATAYVKSAKPHLDLLMETFRHYAREFYGDKPAGLTVRNNDNNENQIRYDIEARIEHDAADGINHVRIFCFDLAVLTLGLRHRVEFVFHDSRLFADMDYHQRLTLFRLADRVCREKGLQYIATINEDHVASMRSFAGADFDRLLVDPRVQELTDDPSGAGKLLGVQVEMNYEDEKSQTLAEV